MEKVQTNPTKVIRAKCLDCSCGNPYEVAKCPVERCPLWPWRMGKNPYRKGPSEAQRETARRMAEKRKEMQASSDAPEP